MLRPTPARSASGETAPPTAPSRAAPAPPAPPNTATGYQLPPPEYLAIVDAEPQPALSFSPDRARVLELHRPPPLPPVAELAREELKVAGEWKRGGGIGWSVSIGGTWLTQSPHHQPTNPLPHHTQPGLRIDPSINSRSRMSHYTRLSIVSLAPGVTLPAPDSAASIDVTGVPAGCAINFVTWSRDGATLAFTVRATDDPACKLERGPLSLWVADVSTGVARQLLSGLNTVCDDYAWRDDGTLVALTLPPGRGPPPPGREAAPPAPSVDDNSDGKTSQARTFQDCLKDETDASLFEYYATSQPVLCDIATGSITPIGAPRLYTSLAPSPDGRYLAVSWLTRPYSYTLPAGRFPRVTQLWDAQAGKCLATLADLPLADDVPIVMDSVRKGPRALSWCPDRPASLSWIEATDGGDPRVPPSDPAGGRDIVYTASAAALAAGKPPRRIASTEWRCGGVAWGQDDLALLYESKYRTRTSRVWALAPGSNDDDTTTEAPKQMLWERSYEDAYADPGSPALARTDTGTYVLARLSGGGSPSSSRRLLMTGRGASPDGARPFVDVFDVDTKASTRVWRSTPPRYESPGSLLTPGGPDGRVPAVGGLRLLLTREAEEEPPQSWIAEVEVEAALRAVAAAAASDGLTTDGAFSAAHPLTAFPHPHPALAGATKRVLRYARPDGVELTATLHTPPGYDASKDGPLPCVVWLYPQEFKDGAAAGQLRFSPHEFASVGPSSPLLLLARGYAVLDGPTIPIVGGPGDAEPNDTYLEQLVASAAAAVDASVATGAVDRDRVACAGHSYGAFSTANLLAHAPSLFAAGIARSGCYNRTLTPQGFQSEERSLWEGEQLLGGGERRG